LANRSNPSKPQLHTVTQLAAELGITARTLRFYEGKGLLTPSRLGTTRVYMARDRARMILILRGKRLGFTLREIAEYLDLYDTDPHHKAQNSRLLKLVNARITKLADQRLALDEMLVELQRLQKHAQAVLANATPETPNAPSNAPSDRSQE
jgi:DNA-binding transcriptional MerR regulator